jgi:hypothetical protein
MFDTHAEPAPFFIVGCSRSGTTLLQALIDAHPDIAIPPESHIYDRFGPFFRSYGDLRVKRNRLRFIEELLGDVFIQAWQMHSTVAEVESRLKRADRVGVIEALFTLYAEKNGAQRWGDKTPEHIRHLGAIKRDFPKAQLIHLVRDGRDVAEAMRRMIWGPVSAVGLAEEWRREVKHWQAHCAENGRAGTLILRYEDLVTSPSETVRGVLEFLGASLVDTVSSYASSPLSRTLGSTQSEWHSSLRQGISAAKVGVYRSRFRPREIEIMDAIAGDALAVYGYERDYAEPRPATFLERGYAYIVDRAVRWLRKLIRPGIIWMEVQYRLRTVRRFGARPAR